ncbi:uncharacterized protein LOC134206974 [Armigeres subalbatus]|uniref:uncharacterized protein LOC134206974 n=1 Tax=Armigeres subalbatus TaxID=124917 RepID=UPI002ED608F2
MSASSSGCSESTNFNAIQDDELQHTTQSSVATTFASNVSTDLREHHMFLSTALVSIKDCNGQSYLARALLDSGSQTNLISERLCQILKLPRKKVNVPISGIGNSLMQVSHSITATIFSRTTNYAVPMDFLVLKKVTNDQPSATIPIGSWNLPSDMNLADPGFNKRGSIDLLLGLEYFSEFLLLNDGRVQIKNLGDRLPLFIHTVFGWIAAGKADLGSIMPLSSYHVAIDNQLDEAIERFWKIEEIRDAPKQTPEEMDYEAHYAATVERNEQGRYVVGLPKRDCFAERIGESKSMALRRLVQLERRFKEDPGLHARYNKAIQEYLDNDHLRLVPLAEEGSERRIVCYLPHHPVYKETSTTTKIRPVFDGSAKTTSNSLLNDLLLTGPVIQETLFNLLLRFRKHKLALVCDVEKMYLQVLVHHEDRSLMRFVYRFSTSDPISTYEFQQVTFGLSSSSFLAIITLRQLAFDEGAALQQAKTALEEDFYDDYIGGADSVETAIQLRKDLQQLLAKGGFRLRKWNSNIKEVLFGMPEEDLGIERTLTFDKEESVKTLGVTWNPGIDYLLMSRILQ